jgi:hypothetical protein
VFLEDSLRIISQKPDVLEKSKYAVVVRAAQNQLKIVEFSSQKKNELGCVIITGLDHHCLLSSYNEIFLLRSEGICLHLVHF